MKVIAVLNQKGGVGKTTLATNIAGRLQALGHDVVLVDSDPQGSARDWAAVDDHQPLMTVGIDRPTLARDVRKLTADFVVIDGAPQAAELAASALAAAHLVVIPVQPSPYDIWATSDLVDLVRQRILLTDGALRAAFVISRAITGTNLSKDIREALEGYELPVFDTVIHQRVDYPNTAASGRTVLDSKGRDDSAAREIVALTDEVLAALAATVEVTR